MSNIILRDITLADLSTYYDLTHPSRLFHTTNGPYFKQTTEQELQAKIAWYRQKLLAGATNVLENKKLIISTETNELIGEVNRYRKSQETNWMEVGVVIFNENFRWKWLWYEALKLRIDETFATFPQLVRLGMSTRSGNIGMMKLAQKLWFQQEACYRKARIVNGVYYDSMSYGILREDRYTSKK